MLKKARYFTKQTGRQGPKSKAKTKLEKVRSEEGNERLGQDEEQRDSRGDDNNGSKCYKYQCPSGEPLLVLQEFTKGIQRKYFKCF